MVQVLFKKIGKLEHALKDTLTVSRDFLPAPPPLVRNETTVKVKPEFTRSSIDF